MAGRCSTRVAAVAGVVAAALLTGCSGDSGDAKNGSQVPKIGAVSTPASLDVDDVTTPLDGYVPSSDEALAVARARKMLINACMADLGYPDNPLPLPKSSEITLEHVALYTLTVNQAKTYGYHAAPTGTQPSEDAWKVESTAQNNLLTGRVRTYNGKAVPSGGCDAEANRKLTKGTSPSTTKTLPGGAKVKATGTSASPVGYAEAYTQDVLNVIMQSVIADSTVETVTKKWSDCMKKQGYDYDSPRSAFKDKKWGAAGEPSQAEIAVAVAHTTCSSKANYLGVVLAVETAYENQYIEQNAETMDGIKSMSGTWLKNANAVLAGG